MRFNPALPELRGTSGEELIFCGIDFSRRQFVYEWELVPGHTKTKSRIQEPWLFAPGNDAPHWLSEDSWTELCTSAQITWALMCNRLNELVYDGRWRVRGRATPFVGELVQVPPDAWPMYEICHWCPAIGVALQTGDRIYSIRAEPAARLAHAEPGTSAVEGPLQNIGVPAHLAAQLLNTSAQSRGGHKRARQRMADAAKWKTKALAAAQRLDNTAEPLSRSALATKIIHKFGWSTPGQSQVEAWLKDEAEQPQGPLRSRARRRPAS